MVKKTKCFKELQAKYEDFKYFKWDKQARKWLMKKTGTVSRLTIVVLQKEIIMYH